MRSARATLVVLPLLGLVAAGCTTGESGSASSAEQGSANGSAGPTSSSAQASTRPAVLKLDGLNPCKAFTADQMKQLGVDKASKGESTIGQLTDVASCNYRPNFGESFTYVVGFVTNEGFENWDKGMTVTAEPSVVQGFPAKQVTFVGDTEGDSCLVVVDVADGQHLYMDYLPITKRDSGVAAVCKRATQAAEFVLTTLPTLK